MRAGSDDGMTLIELLIAIVVLGIIIGPLFGAMYLGLVTNDATRQRIEDSAGSQLMSSYFVTDVQSSDVVLTTGFVCGNAATTKLELQWTDADPAAPTQTAVTYDVVPVTGGPGDSALVRNAYTISGGTCAKYATDTMVHAVDSASPVVTACAPDPADCAHARKLTMTVTAFSKSPSAKSYYGKYAFTFVSARRVAT